MSFERDTYIVLEMPAPLWQSVAAVRAHYGSPLATLPVEITITGSSGVGPFYEDQDAATAFKTCDQVASHISPITMTIRSIRRFPNTGIFYFEPADPQPFVHLQNTFIGAGLKFRESPFPFTPHCTVVTFADPSEQLIRELLSLPVPNGRFVLSDLAMYSLDGYDCRLLHKARLCGQA